LTPFDPANFLESLIRFVAATMNPALSLVQPVEIFNTLADEVFAAPIWSMAGYGAGPRQAWEAVIKKSIQWRTVGPRDRQGDVQLRAQKIYETLLNGEGRPLQMKTINGFKPDGSADGTWQLKNVVFIQTPTPVGPDEKNRTDWIFNTDIDLCKLS
jgi:hypothetical protein